MVDNSTSELKCLSNNFCFGCCCGNENKKKQNKYVLIVFT